MVLISYKYKMLKNKTIFAIAILLVIVGIVYQIKKSKEEIEEIDFQNIIAQENQNIANTEEKDKYTQTEKEYIKIHITGEVKKTGILELEEGARISDAIEKAGGITELADLNSVNLAYCLEDGQKLYIPSKEEKDVQYITTENGENIIQDTKVTSANAIVDINKADKKTLETIPGVGPSMAEKIVKYREENGKFNSIEDLKNVSGIGDKKFESMKEYICVK